VIPLHGVMVQRADWFMEACGMLSTDQVGQLVDQAADDPSVEAIVIDVDSPGGSVFGTPELAAKVAAAAKQKKVIAVANSMAASAAYYVASQASEVVVTPGGMCGSIGVVMMHVDESEGPGDGRSGGDRAGDERHEEGRDRSRAALAGVEGAPGIPDDRVLRSVREGGRRRAERLAEEGEGRVRRRRDAARGAAVRVGMADKVATLDDVLGRYGLSVADVSPGAVTLAAAEAGNIAPAAKSDALDVETRKRRLHADELNRPRSSYTIDP
jgi:membrane-bound ClpP family serine protease